MQDADWKKPEKLLSSLCLQAGGGEADNAPLWREQFVKNKLAFCAFVYVALTYSLFFLYSVTLKISRDNWTPEFFRSAYTWLGLISFLNYF